MSENRKLPAGMTPTGSFAMLYAWDHLHRLVNTLTAPGNQLPAGTALLDALEGAELVRDALARLEREVNAANSLEKNPAIAALIAEAQDDGTASDAEGVDHGE